MCFYANILLFLAYKDDLLDFNVVLGKYSLVFLHIKTTFVSVQVVHLRPVHEWVGQAGRVGHDQQRLLRSEQSCFRNIYEL